MATDRDGTDTEITTKLARLPVQDIVERFVSILEQAGVKVFAVIDQAAEAARVGLELRATTLVIFGKPEAGTPVMKAAPLSALDLPLKVLVWDDAGQTKVSYYSPAVAIKRHGVPAELAANLQAIDTLTTALVSA